MHREAPCRLIFRVASAGPGCPAVHPNTGLAAPCRCFGGAEPGPAESSLPSAPRWASATQRTAFGARTEFPKEGFDLKAATWNPFLSFPPAHLPCRVQICPHDGTSQFLKFSLSVALSLSLSTSPPPPLSAHTHSL